MKNNKFPSYKFEKMKGSTEFNENCEEKKYQNQNEK